MNIKNQLLDLLQKEYDAELAFMDSLSEADRATGSAEVWSPRDLLAHVLSWKNRLAEVLEGAASDVQPPNIDGSTDEINAMWFETSRHKSWETLVAEAAQFHQRTIASIGALPDEALTDPNFRSWMNNVNLLQRIDGNSLTHAMLHFAEFYAQHGQLARASSLLEEMSKALLNLQDDPNWRGRTIYNLACGYALTGQKEKAISALDEAFRLSPSIIEWSKADPDLNSIREEPEFQALYTTP